MSTSSRVRQASALGVAAFVVSACSDTIQAPEPSADLEAPPPVDGRVLQFTDWGQAFDLETAFPGADPNFNTPENIEGCPFVSRDGRYLFIASNREGGLGGIDIWYATRSGPDQPWGEPVNAGPGVNSSANDFCPTLARNGHTFYFVSNRVQEDACGEGTTDIYVTRFRNGSFGSPKNLGCTVNSPSNEFSPFPIRLRGTGNVLYFSSDRPRDGALGGDIYMAEKKGRTYEAPTLVPGINSPVDDGHPNVRKDGLEIYFYSERSDLEGAQGGADIHVATRKSWRHPWSAPVNLGPSVNSEARETRPSLSFDGTELYFGSSRAGSSDVYVTRRDREKPKHER